MKHLYIIGGTMGVGKTTVCRILKERLDRSVFLDGDWCWVMHEQSIMDEILSRLRIMECRVHRISLICTREAEKGCGGRRPHGGCDCQKPGSDRAL